MRPPGTSEQLAKRRRKAMDLLESGEAIKVIARQLGTTERSVGRWPQEAKCQIVKVNERWCERLAHEVGFQGEIIFGYFASLIYNTG